MTASSRSELIPATGLAGQDGQAVEIGAESSLYGQFCPVAMAAELLATRWTLVVLAEMLSGSRKFNDIRRGVPRMSPALLSKRLKELAAAGVLLRSGSEYMLTEAGRDLAPIVRGLGRWALHWVKSDCSLANLDVRLLMWNIRRNLRPDPLPCRRVTVEFRYPELLESEGVFWLIVAPGAPVDLCSIDPGHDVDLLVTADLRAMTSAWMGMSALEAELRAKRIVLDGDPALASTFSRWIGQSGLVCRSTADQLLMDNPPRSLCP